MSAAIICLYYDPLFSQTLHPLIPLPNDHLFSTKSYTNCALFLFSGRHIPVTFIFECSPPGPHNIWGKVWMKNTCCVFSHVCCFQSYFAADIVWQHSLALWVSWICLDTAGRWTPLHNHFSANWYHELKNYS